MKRPSDIAGNKKGTSLIIAITIIMIAAVLIISLIRQIPQERRMSKNLSHSIQAFYAAESGLNIALGALRKSGGEEEEEGGSGGWNQGVWDTSNPNLYVSSLQALYDVDNNVVAYYLMKIRNPQSANPIVESTGYAPTINDSIRSLVASYAEFTTAILGNAIKAKGTVDIQGSAEVEGPIDENAIFSFSDLFGRSAADVKNDPGTQVVIDPPNNSPVPQGSENVTWFEVPPGETAMITQNGWEGQGVLVVEGDFTMTGGEFNGVLYVMGDLSVSGNPDIEGAVFIDGAASDVATITGNAEIEYDEEKAQAALGRQFTRNSWRESYLP